MENVETTTELVTGVPENDTDDGFDDDDLVAPKILPAAEDHLVVLPDLITNVIGQIFQYVTTNNDMESDRILNNVTSRVLFPENTEELLNQNCLEERERTVTNQHFYLAANSSISAIEINPKSERVIVETNEAFDVTVNGSCLLMAQSGVGEKPSYGESYVIEGLQPGQNVSSSDIKPFCWHCKPHVQGKNMSI